MHPISFSGDEFVEGERGDRVKNTPTRSIGSIDIFTASPRSVFQDTSDFRGHTSYREFNKIQSIGKIMQEKPHQNRVTLTRLCSGVGCLRRLLPKSHRTTDTTK